MSVVLVKGPVPLPVLMAVKFCWSLSSGSKTMLWKESLYRAGGAELMRILRAPLVLPLSAKTCAAASSGTGDAVALTDFSAVVRDLT
eukprot:4154605-Ditylum_brightwellii.AAC.1